MNKDEFEFEGSDEEEEVPVLARPRPQLQAESNNKSSKRGKRNTVSTRSVAFSHCLHDTLHQSESGKRAVLVKPTALKKAKHAEVELGTGTGAIGIGGAGSSVLSKRPGLVVANTDVLPEFFTAVIPGLKGIIVSSSYEDEPDSGGGMGAQKSENTVATVYMSPANFLALAAPLDITKSQAAENFGRLREGLEAGYAMGPCRLVLHETEIRGTFQVRMHEGRHRMNIVSANFGPDAPFPVQIAVFGRERLPKLEDIKIIQKEDDSRYVRTFEDVISVPKTPLTGYYRVFITGTTPPTLLSHRDNPIQVFHARK